MTPETIEEIRKWAKDGNEPRFINGMLGTGACVEHWCGDGVILSEAGLAIAAQAERVRELEKALEQARDTAESLIPGRGWADRATCTKVETMRDNCERLLK